MADRTRDTIGETVKILVTWSLAISNRSSISIAQTLHPQ